MKIVGYLRVSTDAQADGQGLDVQEDAIRAWARAGGHRVVAIERDVGVSGANDVAGRPALASALGRLAAGEATAIVVHRLDRLARDVVLQETILADLHRVGLALHSTSAAEDENLADAPDDPTRALVRRILGAVADYERQIIRLRLRAGRARKAAAGGYSGGVPPFGWRAHQKELVENPAEQATLKRMKELRHEGFSLREIGAQLAAEGLPTRAGGPWHPNTLRGALARADGDSRTRKIGSGKSPKRLTQEVSTMP